MEEFEISEKLDIWNGIKKELSMKPSNALFKEGEVWWISVGVNLGRESFGKGERFARPVLVFKKLTKDIFFGLPITSRENIGSWYIPIELPGRSRLAMLHQARIFDRKRMLERMGALKEAEFEAIQATFCKFYCPRYVCSPIPREEAGSGG